MVLIQSTIFRILETKPKPTYVRHSNNYITYNWGLLRKIFTEKFASPRTHRKIITSGKDLGWSNLHLTSRRGSLVRLNFLSAKILTKQLELKTPENWIISRGEGDEKAFVSFNQGLNCRINCFKNRHKSWWRKKVYDDKRNIEYPTALEVIIWFFLYPERFAGCHVLNQ